MKEKKPVSKKLIIVVVVVAVLFLLLVVGINALPEPTETTAPQTTAGETVPQRKDATGKSDKNIADFGDTITLSSIPDDKTGKQKLVRVATTNGNFEEYAKSYYETYFNKSEKKENDEWPNVSESHYIVNFTTKTVTHIIQIPEVGLLELDVTEYISKEEHSVNTIGTGPVLARYYVYLDNGDIEKLDLSEE